ncbi:MAG: deoxynucleoside kinase [Candidatus Falkowbacteria bacterium]
MSHKGKFIVIDGTDGSGKTTQLKLLAERLKFMGHDVEMADFPQYGQKSAGAIEEYLSGKYGQAEEVGPYRASIFYAIDRFDASFKIKKWLDEGKIVLSNRYVAANMAHQGGKINSTIERKIYFNWLHDLEYNIFAIPRPDAVLILHVPAEISQKLTQNQDAIARKPEYTKNSGDIHESNLDHLKKAEEVYLEICEMFSDFNLVECSKNDEIMSREDIHEKVWQEVDKIIKK